MHVIVFLFYYSRSEARKICYVCACTYLGNTCLRCIQNAEFEASLSRDQLKNNAPTIFIRDDHNENIGKPDQNESVVILDHDYTSIEQNSKHRSNSIIF